MTALHFSIISAVFLILQIASSLNCEIIDIKPGSEKQTFKIKLERSTCIFVCSAQGGTNEQWSLTFAKDEATNDVICTAERPGGKSYLYFGHFHMKIKGQDSLKNHIVLGDSQFALLQEEYELGKKKIYVKSTDQFQSKLSSVGIIAGSRDEL